MTNALKTLAPILFLHVPDNASKLLRLSQIITKHYEKNERVMISVESKAAAEYLNQFIWSTPKTSFIPHDIVEESSSLPIIISTILRPLNEAKILINLCSTMSPMAKEFSLIYELDDHSSQEKKHLSWERYQKYQESGHAISTH